MSSDDAHLFLPMVAEDLRDLHKAVESLRGTSNGPIQVYGWNSPGMTPWDISNIARGLAELIESNLPFEEGEETAKLLEDWPASIKHLTNQTVPQIIGGNGPIAAIAIIVTLSALRMALSPLFGWVELPDRSKMPAGLRKKLTGLESAIDAIVPDASKLQDQVTAIEDAAEAAYDLPVSLEELKRARAQVSSDVSDVKAKAVQVDAALSDAQEALAKLDITTREADALIAKVRESQRITTSIGLASAFDERARQLGRTLVVWSFVLVIALGGAAYLTATRWVALTRLAESAPNWPAVGLQIFLSALGLAGPAWLAWIATKQISQRFKLAEDYAFKASVAKAYEGYRREAEALADTTMASRLFDSALTRLDEAPLRFMDSENHGSPWHEFAQTASFKDAARKVPGFAGRYKEFFSRAQKSNPRGPATGEQNTEGD